MKPLEKGAAAALAAPSGEGIKRPLRYFAVRNPAQVRPRVRRLRPLLKCCTPWPCSVPRQCRYGHVWPSAPTQRAWCKHARAALGEWQCCGGAEDVRWLAVRVPLSQIDLDKGISFEEARRREVDFFSRSPVWSPLWQRPDTAGGRRRRWRQDGCVVAGAGKGEAETRGTANAALAVLRASETSLSQPVPVRSPHPVSAPLPSLPGRLRAARRAEQLAGGEGERQGEGVCQRGQRVGPAQLSGPAAANNAAPTLSKRPCRDVRPRLASAQLREQLPDMRRRAHEGLEAARAKLGRIPPPPSGDGRFELDELVGCWSTRGLACREAGLLAHARPRGGWGAGRDGLRAAWLPPHGSACKDGSSARTQALVGGRHLLLVWLDNPPKEWQAHCLGRHLQGTSALSCRCAARRSGCGVNWWATAPRATP